jgi:hypothetical protein
MGNRILRKSSPCQGHNIVFRNKNIILKKKKKGVKRPFSKVNLISNIGRDAPFQGPCLQEVGKQTFFKGLLFRLK